MSKDRSKVSIWYFGRQFKGQSSNLKCKFCTLDKLQKYERGIKVMRYADMPPYAPTLMESTRAIGYSIEAAIADIIDNSVAATAEKIDM